MTTEEIKESDTPVGGHSMGGLRSRLDDLRTPRPGRYVADIGISALLGWGAWAASVVGAGWAPTARAALFVAATLMLYRALAFIHELFHQQAMGRVRLLWHAVAGVPLLLPLLLYLPIHQKHHSARHYGTREDGEYEQFEGRLRTMAARLILLNLALPLALWVRFAVLAPLSAASATVRDEVLPQFVHLSLRMPYRAPPVQGPLAREGPWVEAACCLWAWALMAGGWLWGWAWPAAWAALLIGIATLNTLRALAATHLYVQSDSGRDASGQVADSLNVQHGWLTPLVCPAGLAYHALHHLAPYLPYHALPEAHRRLMAAVGAEHVYAQATVDSLWQGWQRLRLATRGEPCESRRGT